ncbi:MAG: GNAT family N-acetyltransferase, partial [Armatimonadota bacterium]
TEALAAFNCEIHCRPGSEDRPEWITAWTRDLMSGDHPTFKPGDFTIVEDTKTRAILSAVCLIPQTWSYEGIKIGVGLPEFVGTKPKHRRRGLVRAQFEVIHDWSARRNHLLQAITGIPNFYRQFGYEMAVEEYGGRSGFKPDVPKLKKGEKEPYRVRPAAEGDLSFIARVYRRGTQRYLLSCVRSPAVWRYELDGRRRDAMLRQELRVIESAGGERVGFLAHESRLWGNGIGASVYELKPGVSWLAVTPSVVRYLAAAGEKYAARQKKEFATFAFSLGTDHSVYEVIRGRLPRRSDPYALYVRVPDVPGFLRRIAPVLERRLAESVAVGHTGELKLSFYREGVRMAFRKGRLTEVAAWMPGRPEEPESAAFPGLTFLHLLFGHRSLEELEGSYADCYGAGDEAKLLLSVLFPKRPSCVWKLG